MHTQNTSTQVHVPKLSDLEQLARDAGNILLSHFNRHLEVSQKSDNQGIVTNADLASESAIISFIKAHFPGHAILAEESGLQGLDGNTNGTPLWVIDPLDGTTNFSKANPYHCISIGFGFVSKGAYKAEIGVVLQPTTGDLYSAQSGKGCFLNGRRIQIPSSTEKSLACMATGFSSNKGTALREVIESIFALQSELLGVRINGAAALDLATTASGRIQGFYEKCLAPWDMAAGALLVTEAGGKVTNFAGDPFDCLRDADIIAASEELSAFLLNVVQKTMSPSPPRVASLKK